MPLCRASSLDRLLKCPGSLYLPNHDLVTVRSDEARKWGTAVHKWAEDGTLPVNYKFRDLLLRKIAKSGTKREDYWRDGDKELAMAYNVVTGEARTYDPSYGGDADTWKMGHGDEWIVGTLDYGETPFEQVWVDDLKTGRQVRYEDYAEQQKFYCAVYSLVKHGEVRDARSTLTHWPRYPIGGKPERGGDLEYYYEAGALHGFLKSLKDFRDIAMQKKMELLVPGSQCKYCPSRLDCTKYDDQSNQEQL